jgi:hypothetical protein
MNAMKYVGQHPVPESSTLKLTPIPGQLCKEALQKLVLSRNIHRVRHSSSLVYPLSKHSRDDNFKALFLDIGSPTPEPIQLTIRQDSYHQRQSMA